MKELSIEEMQTLQGGGFIAGACVGIGAGSVIYGIGVATNWWNPIGWASATFLVADAACLAYAASNL